MIKFKAPATILTCLLLSGIYVTVGLVTYYIIGQQMLTGTSHIRANGSFLIWMLAVIASTTHLAILWSRLFKQRQ